MYPFLEPLDYLFQNNECATENTDSFLFINAETLYNLFLLNETNNKFNPSTQYSKQMSNYLEKKKNLNLKIIYWILNHQYF